MWNDTSHVNNFTNLFSGCTNLETINISNFDTSKATSMIAMFYNCENLNPIYVGEKWKLAPKHNLMFDNCGTDHVTYVETNEEN